VREALRCAPGRLINANTPIVQGVESTYMRPRGLRCVRPSLGSPPLGLPRMPSVPEVLIPADHPPQGRALTDCEGITRPEGVATIPEVVRQS
jgi:hypothetical protein